MKQWDHCTYTINPDANTRISDAITEAANKLGSEGWELVASIPETGGSLLMLVFKRPVEVKQSVDDLKAAFGQG